MLAILHVQTAMWKLMKYQHTEIAKNKEIFGNFIGDLSLEAIYFELQKKSTRLSVINSSHKFVYLAKMLFFDVSWRIRCIRDIAYCCSKEPLRSWVRLCWQRIYNITDTLEKLLRCLVSNAENADFCGASNCILTKVCR